MRVWVKGANNTADQPEAAADKGFAIDTPTAPSPAPPTAVAPVTAVTLTPSKFSPQPAGTTIVFTAQAIGGVGPHQYQWWVFDDQQWTAVGGWSTVQHADMEAQRRRLSIPGVGPDPQRRQH